MDILHVTELRELVQNIIFRSLGMNSSDKDNPTFNGCEWNLKE